MRVKGWVRLWFVLTVIGVPAAAWVDFQQQLAWWNNLDRMISKTCVDAEMDRPEHPDAIECGRKAGQFNTFFERNNTTPARFWTEGLAVYGAADLLLTAFIVGAFFVARWVVRGFAPPASAPGGDAPR